MSMLSPPPRQSGLSLTELMVGLALGLILTLGLTTLLASTSRSFKVQDDFSRLLDSGTSALRYLVDDIRMAGFYGTAGSIGSVDYASGGITSVANDCGAALLAPARPWALDMNTPVQVNNSLTAATVNAAFPCISAANFLPGSPVIVLRGALGFRVPDANSDGNLVPDLAAQAGSATTLYVQSLPNQDPNTIIFPGSAFPTMKSAGLTRSLDTGGDAPIFEYQAHVYYVSPCSRPQPPATVCDADADSGSPIPTLVRHELSGAAMQRVPLVEGVERLALAYGIDADSDGIVDRFEQNPNWTQVVAVRVTVLARTAGAAGGYDDSAKTYDLGGGATWTCTPGANCNVRRHVFSQIISLRNCAVRRGATGAC